MPGETPYGLALSAGVLAAVNPCGFALLPAYVSLLITGEVETPRPAVALGRALSLTAAMTVGFVAVFGVFGLLTAPVADQLAQRLPWVTVVIGMALTGLGLWLVAGRDLPSPMPKVRRAPALQRRAVPMIGFGVSFAVASLGCTIGPFLGVVVASFTAGSPARGIGLFVAYAVGMALIVGCVTVAVALAQQAVVTWIRRAAPLLSRAAGALMVLAGLYVAWYGWYEIRIRDDPRTTDVVIDRATEIQTRIATVVGDAGPLGLTALLGLIAAILSVLAWRWRRRSNTAPDRARR